MREDGGGIVSQHRSDRHGAIGRGPGDIPALHGLARELERRVTEVEALGADGVPFTGKERPACMAPGLVEHSAWDDRAGAVGEGVGGAGGEAEDVDHDGDVSFDAGRRERNVK
jgi:hypothetical protein